MSIQSNLDKLNEMIDNAPELPLTRGKILIDADSLMKIADNINEALPNEIQQARIIVKDHNKIIEDAKSKATDIINNAKNRAQLMIDRDEITKAAQKKANSIITQAENKSKSIKKATHQYVDELLKNTELALNKNIEDLKQVRQNMQSKYQ